MAKLDQEEILIKSLLKNVGDKISKARVTEKVSNFCRFGNVFLLFELMNLSKEIENIREEIQTIKKINVSS